MGFKREIFTQTAINGRGAKIPMGRLFQKLSSKGCLIPPSSEVFALTVGSSQ